MKGEEQSFREVCTVQHGLNKEMQDAEDDVYEAEEEDATEAGHQELMKRERKKNCQVA